MSWVLTAVLACLFGLALPGSATAQEPPVAAYSFDAGEGAVAEDVYGSHDGTVEGPTWAEGKYGTALEFQGWEESDCVTVPDSPELQLTENFTLEAWIRPEGSLFGDTILFKEFEEQGGGASYAFTVGYSAKGKLEGTIIEEEEVVQTVSSPAALSEYKWAHVAFSFDGEKERLYVNGELVASHTASIGAISSSGPLEIGCAKGWESDYFWGKIDELRIYERTLSEAEVKEDRDAAIQTPPSSDPVAAYSFDAGEGAVAEDVYGSHDGTVEGPTWAEGKYGTALEFQGWEESDCVTVPDSPELQLTENFTLEAWIRPEGSLFGDTILFKEFEELGGGASYAFTVGYSAKGKLEGTIIEEEEVVQTVSSPAALSEYKWAHVAFSFDGEKERLYVNGELVASHTASIGAISSSGPLEIGCAKGWESDYFWGKIDELRIYERTLSEAEVKADKAKDMSPPKIELSGALTEGLKEGTTEYPLKVHATDGEAGRPGVGVKSITISVDGEVADSVEQACPAGSCPLEREWVFDTKTFGFEPHEVTISAEDQGGNLSLRPLPLPVPNGSLPACSLTGPAAETPPDEVEELAGGGQNAIYHGSEGEDIEFPSPPSEFDPKNATDEELDLYGFPPRPPLAEPGPREVWEETVGQAETTAEPGACMGVSSSEFAASASSGAPVEYRSKFAGWHTYDPTGPKTEWRGAFTQYAQPKLRKTCPGEAGLVTWVGIAGPSGAFFQAGTNAPYGFSPKIETAAFTEFFRASHGAKLRQDEQPMFSNLKISPGDRIFAEVMWKPASEEMVTWVQDLDTGVANHPRIREAKESDVYDGRGLQFDIERFGHSELQNFESIGFKYTYGLVSGVGWKPLGALQHRGRTEMQNFANGHPAGHLMSATSRISASGGAGFQEHWHHCHP